MSDPKDFVDTDEPEGRQNEGGRQDSSGLTTEEAENAFEKANDEHFRDDTSNGEEESEADKYKESISHIPQIGSAEDEQKNR